MFQAEHCLYLYPTDPQVHLDINQLINSLKSLQFIDEKQSDERHLIGDRFLHEMTFLGCSPSIEFLPNGDEPYVYVEISSEKSTPKLHFGKNVKVPNCKSCKQTLKPALIDLISSDCRLRCSHCQSEYLVNDFNWRKSAFCAKIFIRIGNIYEAEAVPNDTVLAELSKLTQCSWKYCYIRE